MTGERTPHFTVQAPDEIAVHFTGHAVEQNEVRNSRFQPDRYLWT